MEIVAEYSKAALHFANMGTCYNIGQTVQKKTFIADAVGAKRTWFKSAQVSGHQQDSLSEIVSSTKQQSTKGAVTGAVSRLGYTRYLNPDGLGETVLPDFPQQREMYYADWTHPFAEAEDIAEWNERINSERWQKLNFNESRYYNPTVKPRPNDIGTVVAIGNQSELPIPPGCTELEHFHCVEMPFHRNKVVQKYMGNQLTPQRLQQQENTHILVQWFPTNAAPGRNSVKNPSDDIVRCHICDTVCRNSNTQQCTECQHQTCKDCFGSGSDRTLCQTCTEKDVPMQPRCGSSRTSTISFVYAGDLNHHTAAQNFGIPNSVKHLQQNKNYRLDEGMVRCVSVNVPPCSIKEPSQEAYRAAMNQPSEECVLRKVSVLTTCNTRGEMCVNYGDNMEPISVDNPRFNIPTWRVFASGKIDEGTG